MQAEAERSKLQVLSDQQQVPGQPLQRLQQQQGGAPAHKHLRVLLHAAEKAENIEYTGYKSGFLSSRIQTDFCRT